MPHIVRSSAQTRGLKDGYRSGLEETVGAQLKACGLAVEYESHVVRYKQPSKDRRYTTDFVLPNGIVIETKGRFVTADRQKHLLVQQQHPDLDIRFVFSNPKQRISKQSATTYAMWCEKNGFLFAAKRVPEEWIEEPFAAWRWDAIHQFRKGYQPNG